MSINSPLSPASATAIERTERIWLWAAIATGTILRLAFPSRMAIEHFDEGVYASNFWFGGTPYPAQYLYAPPLLPFAIEWTMIAGSLLGFKLTGMIPMIPILCAGITTIPMLWWIGRRWFGPTAGLTSAWLVATSDFHACYSRAALTDVPVCLFIVLAVYFISLAYARISVDGNSRIIGSGKSDAASKAFTGRDKARSSSGSAFPWKLVLFAGLFTGFAWWTKYNGWLPLAIAASGGAFWQMLTGKAERKPAMVAKSWLVMTIVAALAWSPVLWNLQGPGVGGYAAVASNHRQYLVGLNGWADSAWRQLHHLGTYDNPLDILNFPIRRSPNATTQTFQSTLHSAWSLLTQFGEWNVTLSLLSGLLRESITPLIFPLFAGIVSFTACLKSTLFSKSPSQLLPACLLAAWLTGMTVATPLYYPYPRLILPWLCAVWLGIGLAAESIVTQTVTDNASRSRDWWWKALFVTMGLISLLRSSTGYASAWADRTGLQRASGQLEKSLKEHVQQEGLKESESIIYVFAEPAVVYGLNAASNAVVVPASNLTFLQKPSATPVFLVVSEDRSSPLSESDREKLSSCPRRVLERLHPSRSHLVIRDSDSSELDERDLTLFRIRP